MLSQLFLTDKQYSHNIAVNQTRAAQKLREARYIDEKKKKAQSPSL